MDEIIEMLPYTAEQCTWVEQCCCLCATDLGILCWLLSAVNVDWQDLLIAFMLLGFLCLFHPCWSADWLALIFVVFCVILGLLCFEADVLLCLPFFGLKCVWCQPSDGLCSFSPCIVGGRSRFIAVSVTSWILPAESHSNWPSCVVGSSVAALRSHIVPGCGVITCTLFTWWAGFLCTSNSCCNFSTSAVWLFCVSANELLWYFWFWVYGWFCCWVYGTCWYVEDVAPMLNVPGA